MASSTAGGRARRDCEGVMGGVALPMVPNVKLVFYCRGWLLFGITRYDKREGRKERKGGEGGEGRGEEMR